MSSIRSLDILDIGRSFGLEPMRATPEDIAGWLLQEYANKSGGGFNYNTAITTIYDAFRGLHTSDSAVRHCLTSGNPKGRRQNAEAIRALMPHILDNKSECHRIGLTAIAIGRFSGKTVYAKIKAPLLRLRNGEAFVVMPGLRMSHRPSEVAIDFACSVACETFAQGDYGRADFEYLYAGPGAGKDRQFRAILGKSRNRFDAETIDRLLDIFVRGVALAAEAGAFAGTPKLDGYRIVDPEQPSFF